MLKKTIVLLFTSLLLGCATINPGLISKGMTMEEVKQKFGNPWQARTAKLKDGREIQEWEYFNQGITKTRTLIFFNSKGEVTYWQEYRPWSDRPVFNLPKEVYE